MVLLRMVADENADFYEDAVLQAQSCELRLAEIQNRLKSSFHLVNWLIRSRLKDMRESETRDHVKWVLYMVSTVGLLQERLAHPERPSFAAYLREVGAIWGRIAAEEGVEVAVEADDGLEISDRAATSLALIVHELVSNATEHAFRNGHTGRIVIGFGRWRDGRAELTVSDDGCGLTAATDTERWTAFGFPLVQSLSDQISGSFEIGTGDRGGTRAWVVFPV